MNRTDIPTVEELLAQLARATAEVSALTAQNQQLHDRVQKLEEELALARLHRFAPRSEKRKDRILNEAEQIADTEGVPSLEDDAEDAAASLPDTGLPPNVGAPAGRTAAGGDRSTQPWREQVALKQYGSGSLCGR